MEKPKDILSQPYHIQEYIRHLESDSFLQLVIERLKSLRSFDVQEAGYYGEGVEEIDYENLTGDYISVKDIKKIIEELKNAL